MCGCPRDHLCDLCFKGTWDNLRGVAATRGEVWAMDVARSTPRRLRWPTGNDRMLAVARGKVSDLSEDGRLREELALELAKWAERWWVSEVGR